MRFLRFEVIVELASSFARNHDASVVLISSCDCGLNLDGTLRRGLEWPETNGGFSTERDQRGKRLVDPVLVVHE